MLERFEQCSNGSPAHRFISVEMIGARRVQTNQGREKARRGAGVADFDRGITLRDFTAPTRDRDGESRFISCNFEAQGAQCRNHDPRIPAEEGVAECDRGGTKRGKN